MVYATCMILYNNKINLKISNELQTVTISMTHTGS